VGVQQLGQGVRLAAEVGGDLEGDGAVGELPLAGQEDGAEGAAAKLLNEAEAGEGVADLGQRLQAALQPIRRRRTAARQLFGQARTGLVGAAVRRPARRLDRRRL
jgi:hypothetical protein